MEKQEQEMSSTGASQSLIQAESKRSMTMLQNVLRPFFSKYDVDGSGTLETSELGRVFMDPNEPKSAHELEALFKNFDTDQSGEISFVEFCDGVRSYIGKKKANESAAIDRTPRGVEGGRRRVRGGGVPRRVRAGEVQDHRGAAGGH